MIFFAMVEIGIVNAKISIYKIEYECLLGAGLCEYAEDRPFQTEMRIVFIYPPEYLGALPRG